MTAELAPGLDAIVQRMREHDDLPFPAGSLVPRPCGGHPAPAWRSPGKSAAFAVRLLEHVWTARRDPASHKTGFTTPLAHSAIAWATRHEDLLNPHVQTEGERVKLHPAVPVLRAVFRVAEDAFGDVRPDEVEQEFVARMQIRLKADRITNDAVKNVAYAAPWYRCTCGGDRGGDRPPASPPGVVTEGREAIAKLLEHPGSEWWLMARVFRKLMYGHLGVLPEANRIGSVNDDLPYEHVSLEALKTRLSDVEGSSSARDANIAGGLVAGFCWSVPGRLEQVVKSLPGPVADFVPDDEDKVLAGVVGLQGADSPWNGFAQESLPVVRRLAQDVAADLTSPGLVRRCRLRGPDFKYLAELHMRQHKVLGRFSREIAKGQSISKETRWHILTSRVSHLRDALLMRMSALHSYTIWMHKYRGLESAIRSAELVSPVAPTAGHRPTATR